MAIDIEQLTAPGKYKIDLAQEEIKNQPEILIQNTNQNMKYSEQSNKIKYNRMQNK